MRAKFIHLKNSCAKIQQVYKAIQKLELAGEKANRTRIKNQTLVHQFGEIDVIILHLLQLGLIEIKKTDKGKEYWTKQ